MYFLHDQLVSINVTGLLKGVNASHVMPVVVQQTLQRTHSTRRLVNRLRHPLQSHGTNLGDASATSTMGPQLVHMMSLISYLSNGIL
jgi:hypothetical protein